MRQRPAFAGLACLLAATQASAQDFSIAPQSPAKHLTRAKSAKPSASRTAGFRVSLSEPYGSPKGADAGFPPAEPTVPLEPRGGFSLTAGRDSPDAPMRGGLMFRF